MCGPDTIVDRHVVLVELLVCMERVERLVCMERLVRMVRMGCVERMGGLG